MRLACNWPVGWGLLFCVGGRFYCVSTVLEFLFVYNSGERIGILGRRIVEVMF